MPVNRQYQLSEQVGYILRRANQRHLTIFADHIPTLTPPQFAAIAKLRELGPLSQNELGRQTAMDGATIKGVVDRLRKRTLIETFRDKDDQRRLFVKLSKTGQDMYNENIKAAKKISDQTLLALNAKEQKLFLEYLSRIT